MRRKLVRFGSRESGQVTVLGLRMPGRHFVAILGSLGVSASFYTLCASTYFDNAFLNIILGFSPTWFFLFFLLVFVVGKPPGYFLDLAQMTMLGPDFDPLDPGFHARHRWRRSSPLSGSPDRRGD